MHLHKSDLLRLTFLIEAYEGVASFTTLPFKQHDWKRTVELIVPNGWRDVLNGLLSDLQKEVFPMNVEVV